MSAASANECPSPEEFGQHRWTLRRRVWCCELCSATKALRPANSPPVLPSARVPSQRTAGLLRRLLGR